MIGKIGGFTATVFLGSWGKMVCAFMNKEMERGRDRFWKFWELSPNTGLSHNALIDVNREYSCTLLKANISYENLCPK